MAAMNGSEERVIVQSVLQFRHLQKEVTHRAHSVRLHFIALRIKIEISSMEPVARGNRGINKYHILREFCRGNDHDCIITRYFTID